MILLRVRPLRAILRLFRSPSQDRAGRVLDVAHGGERFRVIVKRVARARRFTLRVRAATRDAVVTMPPRTSWKAVQLFAEQHAAWIADRLGALPDRIPLTVGATIPFRGEPLSIASAEGLRAVAYLDRQTGPDGPTAVLRVSGTPAEQERRVLAFLKREARAELEAAVARHAAAVGRIPRAVVLRDTRSRWGSCSSTAGLNFSWRLVMAPPVVLDYLAAHEVAHLVHLDHSPAYWAVASRLAPELEWAEAWLRANGPALHRFGGVSGA